MKYVSFFFILLLSSVSEAHEETIKQLAQLIKWYAQPYKNFRIVEQISVELMNDFEFIGRNAMYSKIVNNSHVYVRLKTLHEAVIQLKENKEELVIYLFEDLDYLRTLICGMLSKYNEAITNTAFFFAEECLQLLELSKQDIEDILKNHDEIIL